MTMQPTQPLYRGQATSPTLRVLRSLVRVVPHRNPSLAEERINPCPFPARADTSPQSAPSNTSCSPPTRSSSAETRSRTPTPLT